MVGTTGGGGQNGGFTSFGGRFFVFVFSGGLGDKSAGIFKYCPLMSVDDLSLFVESGHVGGWGGGR